MSLEGCKGGVRNRCCSPCGRGGGKPLLAVDRNDWMRFKTIIEIFMWCRKLKKTKAFRCHDQKAADDAVELIKKSNCWWTLDRPPQIFMFVNPVSGSGRLVTWRPYGFCPISALYDCHRCS